MNFDRFDVNASTLSGGNCPFDFHRRRELHIGHGELSRAKIGAIVLLSGLHRLAKYLIVRGQLGEWFTKISNKNNGQD